MKKVMAIVLAGGQGKRMKSKLYKVLHQVCGKPLVGHVVDLLHSIETDRILIVVGHGAEAVQAYLGDSAEYVLQEQQLGTGHAALQAAPLLQDEEGTTMIICGDTPLVTEETVRRMLDYHHNQGAAATILTAELAQPAGYGRVIRDEQGEVLRIVEQKDCNEKEDKVEEINAGTYCFDNRKLFAALKQVTNHNQQQEYYLTDVIDILRRGGDKIVGYLTHDESEWVGINDRAQLAAAEAYMRQRINYRHMMAGVTMIDPEHTYIDASVVIGADTVVMPGCILRGNTVIGEDCEIGPNSIITDSIIGDGVLVNHSTLNQARVGDGSRIGPYAHLRPGSDVGPKVKIGDFVEVKNAMLGEGAAVSHLSYVGDAKVGRGVNIGCGAVTVNYDGINKHMTEIGDGAFIGCNVNLIAPVKIGPDSYVVAGSTITHDVSAGDLAIARERQTNKPGYAGKLRHKFQAKKDSGTQ